MEALSRSACVAPRAPSHSRGLSSRGACSAPLRAQSAAPRRAQLVRAQPPPSLSRVDAGCARRPRWLPRARATRATSPPRRARRGRLWLRQPSLSLWLRPWRLRTLRAPPPRRSSPPPTWASRSPSRRCPAAGVACACVPPAKRKALSEGKPPRQLTPGLTPRPTLQAELPLPVLQTSYAAVLTELGEGARHVARVGATVCATHARSHAHTLAQSLTLLYSLRRSRSLPGFRKGATAPPKVLVAAVGNARFRAACVEHLLQATLEEVCSPLRDQSFQDSEKIVTPMETLTQAFAGAACAPTAALVFDTEVDVMPSLSWTRDYRKLALTVPSPPSEEQLEASAKAALATRRKELGELRVVAGGRGLMAGDVVRLNISAQRIGADGAPGELILSMQHKNLFFDTEVDGAQLPGFVAACEGLKPSESRVFQLAFPQEWNTEALRGVTASFTAACLELFSRTLPDVDDALAPKLRDGCHTLAEVHAALLSDARASAADAADNARRMAVLDALSSAADVQIPQSLFQETGRNLYSAQLLELQAKGQLSPGAMRQMMADSLVEQFFKNKRADIESKVLTGLAVAEVARAEGLCVSEERLAAEVAQGVADFKRWGASYDEQRLTEQAREGLLAQQVLDWVLERATVTEQR